MTSAAPATLEEALTTLTWSPATHAVASESGAARRVLLVTDMRGPFSKIVAACLGALIAVGCDAGDELEGDLVPMCTDELGCPEGTRCVNGQMCEPIPGAEPPTVVVPPQPPTYSPSFPGAQPPLPQLDGAVAQLDAGFDDSLDGGLFECDVGQIACEGQCVDFTRDRRNCGGCGIDCGPAGECIAGTCQRERGPDLPPGNPPFGL